MVDMVKKIILTWYRSWGVNNLGMTKVAPPAVLADGNKALASGEETAAAVMPKVWIRLSLS